MLKHIKDINWNDVFDIWQENEVVKSSWVEYIREHGFASWEEWRMMYANDLNLPARNWALYKISDPLHDIPTFRGGPFKTWIQKHYDGDPAPKFAKLADREDMQNSKKVSEILSSFPQRTTITGLKQGDDIIIIEGMHRCVAIALAAQQGRELDTTIYIALADATGEELKPIGQYKKS